MTGKYEQGWAEIHDENLRKTNILRRIGSWLWRPVRTRAQLKQDLGKALCLLVLGFIAYVLVLGLAGCAGRIAVEQPLHEVSDHQTLRGLVAVSQMGSDCAKQEELIVQTVRQMFITDGLPAPTLVSVRPLSGSSLCGVRKWSAEEIGDPGTARAYSAAKAEVVAYWQAITFSELQRAEGVLKTLAPR